MSLDCNMIFDGNGNPHGLKPFLFGRVNNADPADPADLAISVRDIKVRVIDRESWLADH